MSRPPGIYRQALARAAWDLARSQPAFHWRELASAADFARCLSQREAQRYVKETVRNMARAGHLVPVGEASVPGSSRPVTLYRPAALGDAPSAVADLSRVVNSWAEFK